VEGGENVKGMKRSWCGNLHGGFTATNAAEVREILDLEGLGAVEQVPKEIMLY
jgi:hypothetical protein